MAEIYSLLHHFVLDMTNILMVILELIGAAIIVYISLITFYKFLRLNYYKTSTELRIRLGRGIAMGLQFYLAAEILRLITIRDTEDIYIVGAVILLHVIVTVLVSWEVHHSVKSVVEEEELDEHCRNC
ncbi:MAG TPA: hypothetical protein DEA51_00440 [Erysipelotrichaceae bacterium]|nr:hypothetical protein [Erysipelotrichaceae bacterium]